MPRSINIVSFENKLKSLFELIDTLPDDDLIRSHWARYLCILSYGYVETSVRTILQEYTKNKSHQFISNFVEKRLEQFRNATMNNIKSLIQAFSQSWVESIIEDIDHEIIDAVNSLANNRHQIAHGKNTAVSFVYVKNWHTKSVDLIKYLEHLTNHE